MKTKKHSNWLPTSWVTWRPNFLFAVLSYAAFFYDEFQYIKQTNIDNTYNFSKNSTTIFLQQKFIVKVKCFFIVFGKANFVFLENTLFYSKMFEVWWYSKKTEKKSRKIINMLVTPPSWRYFSKLFWNYFLFWTYSKTLIAHWKNIKTVHGTVM